MKILYFFGSFLASRIRIRIRNLNADPDPDPTTQINADPCGSGSGYGSGSETLVVILEVTGSESGSVSQRYGSRIRIRTKMSRIHNTTCNSMFFFLRHGERKGRRWWREGGRTRERRPGGARGRDRAERVELG